MRVFSDKKFLSLTRAKQHKECALILRTLYEESSPTLENLYKHYCRLIPYPTEIPKTKKMLSDQYHRHLLLANIQLREPRFLPSITQQDRDKAEDWLGVSLYLDNLRSSHNVGSILRTVEAFRLGEVFFSQATPWIDQKQVQDASMGAFEWVKCSKLTVFSELPRPLIALETSSFAQPLHSFHFPASCTIILGNEEYGCSEETLDKADFLVQIPLRGRKNSLNVANALAIVAATIAHKRENQHEEKT